MNYHGVYQSHGQGHYYEHDKARDNVYFYVMPQSVHNDRLSCYFTF